MVTGSSRERPIIRSFYWHHSRPIQVWSRAGCPDGTIITGAMLCAGKRWRQVALLGPFAMSAFKANCLNPVSLLVR